MFSGGQKLSWAAHWCRPRFPPPLAGVFFAYETVLQKQKVPKLRSEADPAAVQRQLQEAARSLSPSAVTIAMVLLAAVLAAIVSQAGLGSSPAFRVPEYRCAGAGVGTAGQGCLEFCGG